jgi:hypothetical protein
VLTLDTSNHLIQYNGISKAWELTNPSVVDTDWKTVLNDGTPIDVLAQDATECMISIPMYTRTSQIRNPKTWEEYISALPEWAGSTLQNMHIEEHTPIWLFPEDDHALIYVVSDGSVIDHRGAYAWVIASSNKVLLSGQGSIFDTSMSSYRAEVFGILAWSLYVWHYSQILQLNIPSTWYPFCDNITAVNSMNDVSDTQPRHSMQSDLDLIVEAKSLLTSHPCQGTSR